MRERKGLRSRLAEQAVYACGQVSHIDRFGQEIIHAGGKAVLTILFEGTGRQGDDHPW